MLRLWLSSTIVLCLLAPTWAAEQRPIERLGSRPALSSQKASPASRARLEADRQDLRGAIRRLEFEAGRRGGLSPSQRRQQEFRPSPAPSAQELGQKRRKLNRLNSLD